MTPARLAGVSCSASAQVMFTMDVDAIGYVDASLTILSFFP